MTSQEKDSLQFFEELETKRLRLRPVVVEDAPAIFREYAADLDVARYLTFIPHQGLDTVEAFLKRCQEEKDRNQTQTYAIIEPPGNELIGGISLTLEDHKISLGYALRKLSWGRGYMTELVRAVCDWSLAQPSIHRVWAVCDIDNPASARVMEKAGMAREGLLKRWNLHPNVSPIPRDCWCYAKIK